MSERLVAAVFANPVGKDCDSICVRIADLSIAIAYDSAEMSWAGSEAVQKFLVEGADPHVRVRAAWRDLDEVRSGKKIFDSGALWQLHLEDGGSYQFRFVSPYFGHLPYKIAVFSPDFTSGEVYLRRHHGSSNQPVYPLEYPLDELLVIHLLAQGRGVEVHAAGLIDPEGNGHLFMGQSGAGKSTLARLWQKADGVEILSDDRIILRNMGERVWIYGTPWHGEARLASPARAPLAHVYFLRHGIKNALVPAKNAEAVGRLFACSFPVFYSPAALDSTLAFLEAVVQGAHCEELSFLPDRSVIEFLRETRRMK